MEIGCFSRKGQRTGRLFIWIMYLLFLLYLICSKLPTGGRWGTGMPLASADSFLSGGPIYADIEEGLLASSSYFPGDIFVAILCRLIFGVYAETAMIVVGGAILVGTIILFVDIAKDNWASKMWLSFCGTAIILVCFGSLKPYCMELHPDVPAAFFCFLGVRFAMNYLAPQEKSRKGNLPLFAVFMFIGGLFKQNAVFIYIGFGLYILQTKTVGWRKKVNVLLAEFAAGIGVLTVVISIKGCWLSTVTVNARHPLLPLVEYIRYGVSTCRTNFLFLLFALVFLVLLICQDVKFETEYQKAVFYGAVFWLAFCMYGAMKRGANEGNMEAAIIVLMPFVLLLIKNATRGFMCFVNKEALVHAMEELKVRKIFAGIVVAMLVLMMTGFGVYAGVQLGKYEKRLNSQREFAEWINENFAGRTIAISSIVYELYNGADVELSTDMYTAACFDMAELISEDDMVKMADQKGWDAIIAAGEIDLWPKMLKKFQKVEHPECISAVPVYVYVKK